MARKIDFERFLIIECTAQELMHAVGTCVVICDWCGQPMNPAAKGYYIAVLNQWFCEGCFRKWQERATWFAEDAALERRHFDFYAPRLGIKSQ